MPLIAVDGPTGVGKSTTARAVAAALGADLRLDPVSVSPLLDTYYTGAAIPSAALHAELSFLHSRADLLDVDADQLTVADFSVMRTAPFAEFLEDPADRTEVLHQLRARLAQLPPLDVLVLLSAAPEALLDRVRRRDRSAEEQLTLEHLEALCRHFATWRTQMLTQARAVIEIDTATWDPRTTEDLSALIDRIRTAVDATDSSTLSES